MQAIAEALRAEDYPLDSHQIDYAVGDIEVEDGQGGYVPVRDLTDGFRGREFRGAEEVVRALHDQIAARRTKHVA